MNKKGIIYKITSPSGRIYIGQTINLLRRKSRYRRLSCKSQPHLYNSLSKYGFDNHIFEVIEEDIEREMLDERECFYIEKYDSFNNGMNMTSGGGSNHKRSPETIEKLRIAPTGNKYNLGKKNALGYIHKEESKKKMREKTKEAYKNGFTGRKGLKSSEEHIRKFKESKSLVVFQYDLNENFIKEFVSIKEASVITSSSSSGICQVCKGNRLTSNGFIWKYKSINTNKKYKHKKPHIVKNNKPVIQYSKSGNIISEYKSAREASDYTGVCWKVISMCVNNKRKTGGKFIWKFK
jgi:group I intron endonuclease